MNFCVRLVPISDEWAIDVRAALDIIEEQRFLIARRNIDAGRLVGKIDFKVRIVFQ